MFQFKAWYLKMLFWRQQKISEKNFLLIVSFLIGLATAFAGVVLKSIIHFIHGLLTRDFNLDGANYLYLIYPVIGIFLAGLFVRVVIRDDISHGVTRILYAIARRNNRIKFHNTYSSVVASAITIGFGGSVGAESPIVYTGAAIGSNMGNFFRLGPRQLLLLIGCGAAGAVAGVFKAPIAGLVFVLEVLMIDLTMTSVLPLLISSVTSATVAYLIYGSGATFEFTYTETFNLHRLPYVLLLGILCGLTSLYFTKSMTFVEGIFRRFQSPYQKLALGGVTLSVLIFLFPPLFGEGYDSITNIINGNPMALLEGSPFYNAKDSFWLFIVFMIAVTLLKVFASSATNGGGGCGGIFAPSLFLGALTGFIYSSVLNHLNPASNVSEKNFALMGMAGIMSGVMHAPLTGIFLIAELTGGYSLFLPLMVVSISAYATIKLFEPNNIYAIRLAQKGELITHHKDKAVLTLLSIESVIEKDFQVVTPELSLGELVPIIAQSNRNLFPVVDKENRFLGAVMMDDIRNIMFRKELYNRFKIAQLMVTFPRVLTANDPMNKVVSTFEELNVWNLPVVDDQGHYLGFVSKAKIFTAYRDKLVEQSDD
ncbi:MAG: chloride channel protein [Bacteroidales bacterium]